MPDDFRIAVKVYANVKGLAETCAKAGLVSNIAHFEKFAHGFSSGHDLFELIDVGQGDGRANGKMAGMYNPSALVLELFCGSN